MALNTMSVLGDALPSITVMPVIRRIKTPAVATEATMTSLFTDEPWSHILKTMNYDNQDELIITADDIKQSGKSWKGKANQFEPRLLAYQTSFKSRPQVFKNHSLFMLPIKNGTYLLTKHNIYKELDYSSSEEVTPIKRNTDSLVLSIGDSETSLIDNLRYSGVFERPEILGEEIKYGPLLNGRHRCDLDFKLGTTPISIKGVQYETDSCFESTNRVLIIEGKSSSSEIDSFNIRQLYFPYRTIKAAVGDKKEIICVFVHKLKDIVHVWKYTFEDIDAMDSIKLLGHYTYTFN
jgi:hypothetical protein